MPVTTLKKEGLMKLNKEIMISILTAAVMTGAGSALMANSLTNMTSYVWIFFAGFTITTASCKGVKSIPNLVCSHAAGWVWALFMYYICLFILDLTGNLALGFFLCIFIGSVVMLSIHLGFTMKTWFNNISIMYGTIFCWFANQDYSKVVYIVIGFLLGGIFSTISDEIEKKIVAAINKKKSTEVQEG